MTPLQKGTTNLVYCVQLSGRSLDKIIIIIIIIIELQLFLCLYPQLTAFDVGRSEKETLT